MHQVEAKNNHWESHHKIMEKDTGHMAGDFLRNMLL